MVEIPDELLTLFSARLERRNGSYVFEMPRTDREHQTVTPEETYRVAVLPQPDHTSPDHDRRSSDRSNEDEQRDRTPPVEKGEVRTVTIDTLGDQGDGIARVEQGYVLIVPDTEPDQEVTIEIEDVKANVGFATVLGEDKENDQEQADVLVADEPSGSTLLDTLAVQSEKQRSHRSVREIIADTTVSLIAFRRGDSNRRVVLPTE